MSAVLAANSPEQAVLDRVSEVADLVTVALDELLGKTGKMRLPPLAPPHKRVRKAP